jgi:hypothetical protein
MIIEKVPRVSAPVARFERDLKKPDIGAALYTKQSYGLSDQEILWPVVAALATHVVERRADAGREIFDAFLRGREETREAVKDMLKFLLINDLAPEGLAVAKVTDMTRHEVLSVVFPLYDRALLNFDAPMMNRLGEMLGYGPFSRLAGQEELVGFPPEQRK